MDPCHSPYTALAGLPCSESTAPEKPNKPPSKDYDFGGLIGTSPAMHFIYNQIERAASSHAPVFITGESGTGKHICAEAIHKYGPRHHTPFIAVHCATLCDMQLKEAFTHGHDGTLFFNEICEMPLPVQNSLLCFLHDHATTQSLPRIICATRNQAHAAIHTGNFREDLFYHLYVLPIHMPSLRERGDDILDLAYMFLKKYADEEKRTFTHFDDTAEDALKLSFQLHHTWAGNIRELQNIIRQIIVMHDGPVITADMLPSYLNTLSHSFETEKIDAPFVLSQDAVFNRQGIKPLWMEEQLLIERAIDLCEGNIPRAAAMLEISPSTIYRKKMLWDKAYTPPVQ